MNVRDWLHVEDHCRAVARVMDDGAAGGVYNVGGSNEHANLEITRLILDHLGKSEDLISYVTDRLGHDRRYAIDSSHIQSELGWSPRHGFEAGIRETIDWYVENADWTRRVMAGAAG
jgi:dTDP-glucose 4,6-dehydratase